MLLEAFRKVFSRPSYVLLSLVTSVAVFAFAVWLPNTALIVRIMAHPGISLSRKIGLPLSLLGSIATNFTPLSAVYTIAIAVLFGINAAMLAYFLKHRIAEVQQGGVATGFFGIASGVIGMGCAACGSFLLTSILSLFGASGILAFLPLEGGEFGLLGVALLGASLVMTARQIQNPAVCKILLQ